MATIATNDIKYFDAVGQRKMRQNAITAGNLRGLMRFSRVFFRCEVCEAIGRSACEASDTRSRDVFFRCEVCEAMDRSENATFARKCEENMR